jgi:hypothetical protein
MEIIGFLAWADFGLGIHCSIRLSYGGMELLQQKCRFQAVTTGHLKSLIESSQALLSPLLAVSLPSPPWCVDSMARSSILKVRLVLIEESSGFSVGMAARSAISAYLLWSGRAAIP